MGKTAIFIQARLGSTRLPCKVLLPLPDGTSVIRRIVGRMNDLFRRRQDLIGGVYLLVPNRDVEVFANHFEVAEQGVTIFAGDEDNVLARFMGLEEKMPSDVGSIMRITGDCPMIKPDVCERVLEAFHLGDYDLCSNVSAPRLFAKGLDCEIFKRGMLARINQAATDRDREHVAAGMYNTLLYRVKIVRAEPGESSELDLSLDTIDDYRRIYRHLVNHGGVFDG